MCAIVTMHVCVCVCAFRGDARGAVAGMGTTESILTEIIVLSTNERVEAFKAAYEGKFDRPLIDVVRSECSGDYEKFLIACLRAERDEGEEPDEGLAEEQAAALHKAAKGFGTDEDVFVEILSKASVEQADLIQAAYESNHGKSLKAMIVSELKGDLEFAMLLRLESRIDAQCTLLAKGMKGMGTDEGAIARILGGSTKAECAAIHARYDEKYGGNLIGQLKVGGARVPCCARSHPIFCTRCQCHASHGRESTRALRRC